VAMSLSDQSKKAVLDFCTSSSSQSSLEEHHSNLLLTNLFYGDDDESWRRPESDPPLSGVSCLRLSYINALNFCVHYLCLKGWVYLFYVGHIDKIVKPFSMF
jgi:hypothetical protein